MYIKQAKDLGYYSAGWISRAFGISIYQARQLKVGHSITVDDDKAKELIEAKMAIKLEMKEKESEEIKEHDHGDN